MQCLQGSTADPHSKDMAQEDAEDTNFPTGNWCRLQQDWDTEWIWMGSERNGSRSIKPVWKAPGAAPARRKKPFEGMQAACKIINYTAILAISINIWQYQDYNARAHQDLVAPSDLSCDQHSAVGIMASDVISHASDVICSWDATRQRLTNPHPPQCHQLAHHSGISLTGIGATRIELGWDAMNEEQSRKRSLLKKWETGKLPQRRTTRYNQ